MTGWLVGLLGRWMDEWSPQMSPINRARLAFRNLARGFFLEASGNWRARLAALLSIPDGSFKSFETYIVQLSAKETK